MECAKSMLTFQNGDNGGYKSNVGISECGMKCETQAERHRHL